MSAGTGRVCLHSLLFTVSTEGTFIKIGSLLLAKSKWKVTVSSVYEPILRGAGGCQSHVHVSASGLKQRDLPGILMFTDGAVKTARGMSLDGRKAYLFLWNP
ncbi:hypothetical protein EDD85DRAFT_787884 [Armillaria nabsnona]|nr:hypothetical protein EDD85DRAFT_787884 [Armillaria nabsnona]